jgi:hypothetical protein
VENKKRVVVETTLELTLSVYKSPVLPYTAEMVPAKGVVSLIKDGSGAVMGCFGPTTDGGYSFCVGGLSDSEKPLVVYHASREDMWNAFARHTVEGNNDAEKRD